MTTKSTPQSILIIVDTLGQGGLARVQLDLAQAWLEKGYKVGIISLNTADYYQLPQIHFFAQYLDQKMKFRWQGIFKRQAITHWIQEQIAIFETQLGPASLIIGAGELALRTVSAIKHPAIVLSSHSSQLQAAKSKSILGQLRLQIKTIRRGWRLQKLLNGKKLHVVSNGLGFEMTQLLRVKPAQLSAIYNPFDFHLIRAQGQLLSPQANSIKHNFIIGVGHLTLHKGFHKLIQAFAKSQYTGNLVLVGQGPEEPNLRQLAVDLKLENRVYFFPFHENHYSLVQRSQLLVLCSEGEGLGNVLIEALILGVPVLSTDCPYGPKEIIEPICPDALIQLNDIEALSEKIEIYTQNPYPIEEALLTRFEKNFILNQYQQLLIQ